MNGQLSTLEGFDSGSNYKFGDKMHVNKNPRSLFDLSHLNTLTINNCGLLVPIALWETLPSDDFDISVDALLRVLPQVVPLYSRQRMYIYGFYSRYSDLWNNWQVFMDKGYTGNVTKTIPTLHYQASSSNNNVHQTYTEDAQTHETTDKLVTPDSLFDYLGLPIGASLDDMFNVTGGLKGAGISALPFMMYLRIYRDYFMNKNHWINDRVMLPDDDSRFRLDDSGNLLSAKDESKKMYFDGEFDITIDGNNYTMGLMYHDYPDDYFISALPFTQRGTAAQITKSLDVSNLALKVNSDSGMYTIFGNSFSGQTNPVIEVAEKMTGLAATMGVNTGAAVGATINNALNNSFEQNMIHRFGISGDNISIGITLEDIRKLAVQQQELEQLARTDGSYRQFGLSFFGESSKASYDFRPIYIGGTYKNISFTEVLQTSGQQMPSEGETGTPLGAYAGHGITGISSGRIGHIHCDDYGMIMLIACIMPDVYYSQGLDRIFTDSLQSEKFMPERAKLGMQPILNKELYYAGNNGNNVGDDNYLWAYQNPYDWLRYMPNKIHGKIADSTNNSFFPYTQSRKFTQLPNWGRAFSNASDVRKDYLFSTEEDAYSAQFSINVRAVRPLPYKAIPAELVH